MALSLIPAYADQFLAESRTVPVVSDLFNTENLDMNFPELLKLCLNVNLDISDEQKKSKSKKTQGHRRKDLDFSDTGLGLSLIHI